MSYTSLAQSAVDWALSKVGCAYSQARRMREVIFDGASRRLPLLRAGRRSIPTSTHPGDGADHRAIPFLCNAPASHGDSGEFMAMPGIVRPFSGKQETC